MLGADRSLRYHCPVNLEALAGQVLIVGFPAGEPPAAVRRALANDSLGGVILFRRNIEGPHQVAEFLRSLLENAIGAPLVAIDQEGGRVQRLRTPVLELPPMRAFGQRGDAALTREAARLLGGQLRALGFSMNFAPVLDVDSNPANPVIGDRSFSADPRVVIEQGLAFAAGLSDAGMLACGKHFPGHGDTDLDSHLALPVLRHDRARLDTVELAPFRRAHAMGALMTAHVVFEGLDPTLPATLSPKVVRELLREDLGYPGVVISDDLEMKAVRDRWGVLDGGLRAIEAGCDMLLVCSDVDACFKLRSALAARAEVDRAFRARLTEAAERGRALRQKAPPRVGDVRAALDDPAVRAMAARFAELER